MSQRGEESGEQRYRLVHVVSRGGTTKGRYYHAVGATCGVVMVGGVGGDFDTPARGLYPRLAVSLQDEGLNSLRVEFRAPDSLSESIVDTLAGISFLLKEGCQKLALVGHSLGGAVVAQAASRTREVNTVVLLSTQTYGVDPVTRLDPRVAVLLIHGKADNVLSYEGSKKTYARVHAKKRLLLYEGAGHCLDEVADDVYHEVRSWILENLC